MTDVRSETIPLTEKRMEWKDDFVTDTNKRAEWIENVVLYLTQTMEQDKKLKKGDPVTDTNNGAG